MHCFRFAVLLCVIAATTVIAVPVQDTSSANAIADGEGYMLYYTQT